MPAFCFSRPSRAAALLVFALLFAGGGATMAAPPPPAPISYYGVYLQNAKVGSLILKREETRRDNAPAIRVDSTMTLDLQMLGAPARIVSTTVAWSDAKGKPLALDYKNETAGRVTHVTATYTDHAVTYDANLMGTAKKATLTLAPGEQFVADTTGGGGEFQPRPGLTLKGKIFSPETLSLLDSETTVTGEETVAVGDQSVRAFKAENKTPLGNATLWLTEAGDLLRMDAILGLQILREPKAQALAAPESGKTLDITAAIGITPTGEALTNPRTLRRAEYEIRGLTKPLPLQSDSVQTITHAPDPDNKPGAQLARVTVTASPLPDGPTVPLQTGRNAPAALQPFLQPTTYVPSDDPKFRELARTIVAGETDSARAAAKIAAWVHEVMTPDPGIAALRPAREILDTRRGVCRDYTTLFAAIARAAGLPTKQCVGVAFVGGRFLYHAWPEVWVGNDTWIALEPTWGVPFADATHIKLAEGEITDVFTLAQDFGKYQIRVLSAR